MNDKPKKQQPGEAASTSNEKSGSETTEKTPDPATEPDKVAETLEAGIEAIHDILGGDNGNLGLAVTVFHIYQVTGIVTQRRIDKDIEEADGPPAPVREIENAENLFRYIDMDHKTLDGLVLYYIGRISEPMVQAGELLKRPVVG